MPTTHYQGKVYNHDDYKTFTSAKFMALPEPVKKAIQGDEYKEPEQIMESEQTETTEQTETVD